MITGVDVWIVDDDEAIRFVLQRALRKRGYEVECFDEVRAVSAALESGHPQAILTDIRLPDADGLSVVDMLAQRAGIPGDRGSHTSSVASFAGGGPKRAETPAPIPSQRAPGEAQQDERFDGYSRMIAEAERQTRKFRKQKAEG